MRIFQNPLVALCLGLLAVASAAQQPPAATAQPASGYVLGPDDQIVIRALEGLDLADKPVLIGANGNITLPLIGRLQAAGLTVEQLEAELASRLKTYVQEPQISVTVTEFRSQPVSVFGAVTTPGVVQLRGRKTLYEVLSMAGGPRETAGSIVSITRRRENGEIPLPGASLDSTGQFSSAALDIQEILDGKNPAANIEIKPHDVISVSQGNARLVYVVGDVQRAGAFNLGGQRTISVLSALSLAGGFGRTAKPDRAKVFRPSPDGRKHEEIAVNIKQILDGKAEDIGLRPQDVLVVPTSSRKAFAVLVSGTLAGAVSAAIYAGAVH
ncbi:MAG: polysaccharide export protein [Acidobacteriia bacterium]|nr:polysaccharide export protein [Terriglobia bacterium]